MSFAPFVTPQSRDYLPSSPLKPKKTYPHHLGIPAKSATFSGRYITNKYGLKSISRTVHKYSYLHQIYTGTNLKKIENNIERSKKDLKKLYFEHVPAIDSFLDKINWVTCEVTTLVSIDHSFRNCTCNM